MDEEIEIKPLDTLLNFVKFMHVTTENLDSYINLYQGSFERFELKKPETEIDAIMNNSEFFLGQFILFTKETFLYIRLFWEQFYGENMKITGEELERVNILLSEFYSQYSYVITKFKNYKKYIKKEDCEKMEKALASLIEKYDLLISNVKKYNEQTTEKLLLV